MGNDIKEACSCNNNNTTNLNEYLTIEEYPTQKTNKLDDNLKIYNDTAEGYHTNRQVKGGTHQLTSDVEISKSRGSKADIDKNKLNVIAELTENASKTIKSSIISNGGTDENSKKIKKIYSLGVIEEIKEKSIEDNIILYSDGTKYQGTMNQSKRSGKGILFKDSRTIYDGEWFNNVFHGRGILYLDNGMIYDGNFINGRREGNGIQFSQETRESYSGEWKDDEKSGEEKYTDGSYYIGTFRSGKKNGKGQFYLHNGAVYEGEFVDDNIEGTGSLKWSENKIYTGEWKNNALNGFGTFIQKGKVFKGNFKNDKKHGYGINIYPNDSYILSNYEDDFMVGISIFHDKESNKELIYKVIKGKQKQLVDNVDELERIIYSNDYLQLKYFLNDLKSKGILQF